jgi:hypothetical protein
MAEIITHSFVSGKSQSPDTTLVSKNEWNDGHVFGGGINGQVLVYDNTADNNIRWTDGSANYLQSATIANPTTSPAVNVINISFTSNSAINIITSVIFSSVTTTGSAAFTPSVYIDGVLTASFPIGSGLAVTALEVDVKGSGAHTVTIDIASVGNVTFTGGIIQATVLTLGV